MRKLLKKYGFVPDKLVTDDLRSYAAAAASDLGITRRHERGRWRNNRAENQEHRIRAKISLNPRSHLYPAISGYRKCLSGNHVYGQAFLKSFDAVKRDRVTDALFMALHQISR
jgi:transposase-like protein